MSMKKMVRIAAQHIGSDVRLLGLRLRHQLGPVTIILLVNAGLLVGQESQRWFEVGNRTIDGVAIVTQVFTDLLGEDSNANSHFVQLLATRNETTVVFHASNESIGRLVTGLRRIVAAGGGVVGSTSTTGTRYIVEEGTRISYVPLPGAIEPQAGSGMSIQLDHRPPTTIISFLECASPAPCRRAADAITLLEVAADGPAILALAGDLVHALDRTGGSSQQSN